MQTDPIYRMAESLIYNAPELAVWCWALLQTLHPEATWHAGRIRLAMILLLVLLLATPVLYTIIIEVFQNSSNPEQIRYAIDVARLLLSLIHAWCWLVVLKAAFENRRQRTSSAAVPSAQPPEAGEQ